jgi:superfamily I DNA and/or RNA helicase
LYSGAETTLGPRYADWLGSKAPCWNIFDNRHLVWLDYNSTDAKNNDYCSPDETKFTIQLIEQFISAEILNGNEKDYPKLIGVITFYDMQKEAILDKINGHPEFKDYVDCGNVDAFQGKEYPVVILCCSRRNSRGNVGFMNLPSRVNVAVSRAQRQLIIVGSMSTILHEKNGNGSQPFKDFVNAAGDDLLKTTEIAES